MAGLRVESKEAIAFTPKLSSLMLVFVGLTTHSTSYFEPNFYWILPFDRLILQIFTINQIFYPLLPGVVTNNRVSFASTP